MRLRSGLGTWLALLVALQPFAPAMAGPSERWLGRGEIYATPYYVYLGGLPGPTVLVEGGIHGNEQSGMWAIEGLLGEIELKAGKLILLPRMNRPAIALGRRYVNVDLNRVFGQTGGEAPAYEYRLAAEIQAMAAREGVQHLLTLHDSQLRHDPLHRADYGQTICYGTRPPPVYLEDWLDRLNRLARSPEERFHGFYSPIATSSTEVLVATLGLQGGFCGETWLGLPEPRRIARQEHMILTLLEVLGLVYRLRRESEPD